jgi:TPR repeat protein
MKKLTTIILAGFMGFAVAQANAGESLDKGMFALLKGDTDSALKVFRPLAQEGDAEAQYHLGYMYQTGTGVQQNDVEALTWYQKAASNGHHGAAVQTRLMSRHTVN